MLLFLFSSIVHFHIIVHNEPSGIPKDWGGFKERVRNFKWLISYLDSLPYEKRPKLCIEFQGDFADSALLSFPEAETVRYYIKKAAQSGHTFGIHAHQWARLPDGRWAPSDVVILPELCLSDFEYNNYIQDSAKLVKGINDHIRYVDSLIMISLGIDKDSVEKIVKKYAGAYACAPVQRMKFMEGSLKDDKGNSMMHGFKIETNFTEECFYEYFQHSVWNPFRPDTTGMLWEDPDQRIYVRTPTAEVIGGTGTHYGAPQDGTVPARQKDLIMLLLNKWYLESKGIEKVWDIALTLHFYNLNPPDPYDHELSQRRDEFKRFVEWMNKYFIGKDVKWSTPDEIYEEFIAWENAHPGESSFEYKGEHEFDLENYPYPLKGLVKYLYNTHLDSVLKYEDLKVFELTACPSTIRGDKEDGYWVKTSDPLSAECFCKDIPDISGKDLQTYKIYLLQSNKDTTVNFYYETKAEGNYEFFEGLNGKKLETSDEITLSAFIPVIAIPKGVLGITEKEQNSKIMCISYLGNTLKIKFNFNSPHRVDIAIYDPCGRKVLHIFNGYVTSDVIEKKISVSPGVYFVKIKQRQKIKTFKILSSM